MNSMESQPQNPEFRNNRLSLSGRGTATEIRDSHDVAHIDSVQMYNVHMYRNLKHYIDLP